MSAEYDFIVVGAGAGGGPLACNLALAPEGYRVALLDAGADPCAQLGSREYYNYSIPALHACASEDPEMSWSFFVKHYTDPVRQAQDSKFQKDRGIFYPRAAAVGGCTAHHALITVYPHHDDWKRLATLTGDPSWSPENMRTYFERLEECHSIVPASPDQTRDPTTRHGLTGWLPVTMPDPTLALGDPQLLRILLKAFLVAYVAAEQPEEIIPMADKIARAIPENKKRSAEALNRAVGRFIDAARRVAVGLPDSVRATLAAVSTEVSRLEKQARTPEELLNLYAEVPSLLELFRLTYARLDPNRWFEQDAARTGVFNTPASILYGVRSGVRERVLAVRARYPERLILLPNALATEVVLEGGRAVGVRYIEGAHQYRASPRAQTGRDLPPVREVRVRERGEIILAGGAFNTPQLLMLSGIGPADQLRKHNIAVKCNLPGVGKNLQDRYEVGLVSELPTDFRVLEGSKFQAPDGDDPDDRALQEWMNHRGVYATNGVVLSIIRRSSQAESDVPDLYLFGIPGYFRGYIPGYCREGQNELKNGAWVPNHRRFTWAILKGRTRNRNGQVLLSSSDPRQPPDIHFHYFDEGSPGWEKDLNALVEGVRFAARIMEATGLQLKTLVPKGVNIAKDDELREFIKGEAWGHHACGTCKIGRGTDKDAVLDGDFRVRGAENLRVVDASVFPEIPGFFILVPIYMISEKASDVILADRRRPQARPLAVLVK
jgi:choline dehydrogenase